MVIISHNPHHMTNPHLHAGRDSENTNHCCDIDISGAVLACYRFCLSGSHHNIKNLGTVPLALKGCNHNGLRWRDFVAGFVYFKNNV